MKKGADSELPGWQPKEKGALTAKARYDCSTNATVKRRPEAVGAGPLTASRRGLWVSGLLSQGNGGQDRRAATLEPTT